MAPFDRPARTIALLGATVLLWTTGCAAGEPLRRDDAPAAVDPIAVLAAGPAVRSPGQPDGEPLVPPTPKNAGKPGAWQVDPPPGPTKKVQIDTRRGTWMDLDVSPDGETVVFGLLGDLYLLPIQGGEARALTQGVAWDMHPRFSPDGRHIAFTSDRKGGDNLFVVALNEAGDAAKGEPRAITQETFRLYTQPAWHPSGRFVVGRKHFTSRRSIGAGEFWLHDLRKPGAGLQLTKRKSEQKDTGEPAFSPDGRFLYYSRDATPGPMFEYGKDPHRGIYVIERYELQTGRISRVTGGPGGAVRPTPSRDGKQLAFIRRVGTRSALYVRDLSAGTERLVWAGEGDLKRRDLQAPGLDRDLQETWAIHGVYPQMAWLPDHHHVVLSGRGRLWKVDTRATVPAGAQRFVEIPFHVQATHTVAEAVRFPVDVAPRTFDVRLLRDLTISPDGKLAVFRALGRLYIRALPDGTPRKLTRDASGPDGEGWLEMFPTFSPDGRHVVYATWDDNALGSIRAVALPASAQAAARGGHRSRLLSRDAGGAALPGHYVELDISPDGTQLVFRRVPGGWVTDPAHSHEPGIFTAALDLTDAKAPWQPVRVDRGGGVDAHFADRSDRVYFLERKQSLTKDPRTLVSTRLDGTKKREHAQTEAGVRMRISPDGRHIAWSERHRTWLAPWLQTGKVVELGPGKGGVPVVQLSRWSGFDLQWSRDSERLVWLLGPAMYERTVADAVAKLAGDAAKKPTEPTEPEEPKKAEGAKDDAKRTDDTRDDSKDDADVLPLADAKIVRRPISFAAKHHEPKGQVAFVGGRVVTMDPARGKALAEQVIDDGVVLIEGGRIKAVGKRGEVAVPGGARTFDAKGMTIIPGLVDVHAHGAQGAHGITPERAWLLDAMLAFGVTTMHDPSNDSRAVFAARERVMAGLTPGPRIFSTGTILYGAMGHYHAPVASVQDAVLHLFRLREMGAISVKSYNQPRRDQRQQVLAAARRLKMMVVPEGGALFQHNITQVVDGHTGVEHALPVGRLHDDVLQLWSQTAVGWTPTLGVAYGGLGGEHYWYQHTRVDEHRRLRRFVRPDSLRARGRWPAKHAPEADYNHIFVARDCKRLVDAGGRVQLGAHGQREGLAAHWELWMLAQGGMTPLQALRAGTLDGARYLGMDGDIGSITAGKLADLAIIEGDVTTDIRRSEHVRWTVAHGRVYDAATMAQLAPQARPAPTYFFSRTNFGAGASDAETQALGSCHGCDRH